MEPRDLAFADMDFRLNTPGGVGSRYDDPAVAMLDGSVQRLRPAIQPDTLRALLTIRGGEPFRSRRPRRVGTASGWPGAASPPTIMMGKRSGRASARRRSFRSAEPSTIEGFTWRSSSSLCPSAVFLSFGVGFAADEPKDEAKKLQGTWQVTKFIDHSEEPAEAKEIEHFTFEFKGDTLTVRKEKDDSGREMKYALDATKKPKGIDLKKDDGGTSEGIYKLDGDELTICVVAGKRSDKAAERPAEFKASKGSKHSLFVLKKVKE